jgi:hypothetical protein
MFRQCQVIFMQLINDGIKRRIINQETAKNNTKKQLVRTIIWGTRCKLGMK